jgi:hypothetical protein
MTIGPVVWADTTEIGEDGDAGTARLQEDRSGVGTVMITE